MTRDADRPEWWTNRDGHGMRGNPEAAAEEARRQEAGDQERAARARAAAENIRAGGLSRDKGRGMD